MEPIQEEDITFQQFREPKQKFPPRPTIPHTFQPQTTYPANHNMSSTSNPISTAGYTFSSTTADPAGIQASAIPTTTAPGMRLAHLFPQSAAANQQFNYPGPGVATSFPSSASPAQTEHKAKQRQRAMEEASRRAEQGIPCRQIFEPSQMSQFLQSKALDYYKTFLLRGNELLLGKAISSIQKVYYEEVETNTAKLKEFKKRILDSPNPKNESLEQRISQVLGMDVEKETLDNFEKYSHYIKYMSHVIFSEICGWTNTDECKRVEEKGLSRFGNIAYRYWSEKLIKEADNYMGNLLKLAFFQKKLLQYFDLEETEKNQIQQDKETENQQSPQNPEEKVSENVQESYEEHEPWMAKELFAYFTESFGNQTRIDYGTGHEANFVALMCCLTKLLGLSLTSTSSTSPNDIQFMVGILFPNYLTTVRHIQTYYRLEPAGSRGVWGLDDYQFLPFLWGSAQLVDHPLFKPKSIHNNDVVQNYSKDFMYFEAIRFIKSVKSGLFGEHSPLLNDISSVPTWNKVNSGMIKMYDDEVLKKFVVIQHFMFGKLMAFEKK